MYDLTNMTQAKWQAMTPFQRKEAQDLSALHSQVGIYRGRRVEVVTIYNEKRRFWVGQSTGWRPCNLEILTRRSSGGAQCETCYASVRLL